MVHLQWKALEWLIDAKEKHKEPKSWEFEYRAMSRLETQSGISGPTRFHTKDQNHQSFNQKFPTKVDISQFGPWKKQPD